MTCGTLITSDEVPVIHRMITIMQRQAEEREMALSDKLSYHWEGVKFLMHHSLWDALHMDSASFVWRVLSTWKHCNFNVIFDSSGVDGFSAFMDHFLKRTSFQEVSLDYFLDVFRARFNWDLRNISSMVAWTWLACRSYLYEIFICGEFRRRIQRNDLYILKCGTHGMRLFL